jgi:hypothetical protein
VGPPGGSSLSELRRCQCLLVLAIGWRIDLCGDLGVALGPQLLPVAGSGVHRPNLDALGTMAGTDAPPRRLDPAGPRFKSECRLQSPLVLVQNG